MTDPNSSEGAEKGAGDASAKGAAGVASDGAKGSASDKGAAGEKSETKTVLGGEKSSADGKAGSEGAKDKAGADGAGDSGEKEKGKGEPSFDSSKLKMPEGTSVDEKWMGKFVELPGISKLNQEDAQRMVDALGEYIAEQQPKVIEAVRAQLESDRFKETEKQVSDYSKAIEGDEFVKKHGGLEKIAPLAVAARDALFGAHPEFKSLIDQLNRTGLGSHPAMVAGLAKFAVDYDLSEGKMQSGGQPKGDGKERAATKLFRDYEPGGKYGNPVSG